MTVSEAYKLSRYEKLVAVVEAARKVADPRKKVQFSTMPPVVQGILVGYTEELRNAIKELERD